MKYQWLVSKLIGMIALLLIVSGCETLSTFSQPSREHSPDPSKGLGDSSSPLSGSQPAVETSPTESTYSYRYPVIGASEYVTFKALPFIMEARVDTGATTSSIDARDIQEFERDGEEWVRFSIPNRETEERFELERPVIRIAHIEQHGRDHKRKVVDLTFAMGDKEFITRQFTLKDRKYFDYPVLIGRNVLEDRYLVDAAAEHLLSQP